MTDGSQYFELIFLALLAVFIGLRLRAVLGDRSDQDPSPPPATDTDSRVVPFPARPSPAPERTAPVATTSVPGLEQIRARDPSFEEESFLVGAAGAFELILSSFAKGDEQTLRQLVDPVVLGPFSQVISDRRNRRLTCEHHLVRLEKPTLVEARCDGPNAQIMVRFVSEQISLIRDADGQILEGQPGRSVMMTDRWVFARDCSTSDPTWTLMATIPGEG